MITVLTGQLSGFDAPPEANGLPAANAASVEFKIEDTDGSTPKNLAKPPPRILL